MPVTTSPILTGDIIGGMLDHASLRVYCETPNGQVCGIRNPEPHDSHTPLDFLARGWTLHTHLPNELFLGVCLLLIVTAAAVVGERGRRASANHHLLGVP